MTENRGATGRQRYEAQIAYLEHIIFLLNRAAAFAGIAQQALHLELAA